MDAGRELDTLIAEKAMGLEIVHRSWPCGYAPDCGTYEAALYEHRQSGLSRLWPDVIYKTSEPLDEWRHQLGLWCEPVPHYSTDIAAAWTVVERLEAMGWVVRVSQYQLNPTKWNCRFVPTTGEMLDTGAYVFDDAPTAPHAICLAALKVFS